MRRLLSVFDFDHTIVNENSDVILRDLLPKEVVESQTLRELRPCWTSYMAEIFRLFPEHGIFKNKFEETCQKLSHTHGMSELLVYLGSIQSDIVIMSDANLEIISTWLKHNHPRLNIKVFTNPAFWDNDVLKINPYQEQTSCQLCSKNICKGSILLQFLEAQKYETILYTGDGKNDLCPSQKLKTTDYVFPRAGYALDKLLKETEIKAKVYTWQSAQEIKEVLTEKLDH